MALISESTFNPLARYVNVRLQQGVPIVDADINELDDIRQFELRAFLKWFVGDGVPDGNDGFRIQGTGAANDFAIRAGRQSAMPGDADATERGLHQVGRIIVDGLDVMIDGDVNFTEQPLHETFPRSASQAARLGVSAVAKLETPAQDGQVAAYLDVWQSLVTADDADGGDLVHQGLGVETCARLRREWAVRVRGGAEAPTKGGPDFVAGHSYSLLAVIDRRKDDDVVRREDVDDRRHQRLQLTPATLVEDVMGTSATDYRAGRRRPPISLREALNALMHDELPTTDEFRVAPSPQGKTDEIGRAFLHDRDGGVVTVFKSDRDGTSQVYAARMRLDAIERGFDTVVPVTSGVAHSSPSVTELPDGSLFVVYQTQALENAEVHAKHALLTDLGTADQIQVAATPGISETAPFAVLVGSIVTVFVHVQTPGAPAAAGAPANPDVRRWHFRRWSLETQNWVEGELVKLTDGQKDTRDLHAARASDGTIWASLNSSDGVFALQLDPGTGRVVRADKVGDAVQAGSSKPFVLCPRSGGAWVFWQNNGLFANRIENAPAPVPTKFPNTDGTDTAPCAVEDADGKIWLIWSHQRDSNNIDIVIMRRDDAGVWGRSRPLVANPTAFTAVAGSIGVNNSPMAVAGKDTTVSVFWSNSRQGTPKIFGKRFVTAV